MRGYEPIDLDFERGRGFYLLHELEAKYELDVPPPG
jgi:hypothetical protein